MKINRKKCSYFKSINIFNFEHFQKMKNQKNETGKETGKRTKIEQKTRKQTG